MTLRPSTFLFMPESAYGPTNNLVGMGAELKKRGHRIVFAAEASWKGKLVGHGFEEDLVDLSPPAKEGANDNQDAGAFWKEYIRKMSPEFRKTTAKQLETVIKPIWEELFAGARYCEAQLKQIIERVRPDVIIEDNVIAFPALVTAGVPFVRSVCCNPLEMPDPSIPPVFSGLASDRPETWPAFRAEYERTHRALWEEVNAWVQEQGAPSLPYMEFIHRGAANLYIFPTAVDYLRERPLDATWHNLESSVRETETDIELPERFLTSRKPLVYFSLGSLGGADVDLMKRVVEALTDAPVNVVVSKGPRHTEFELAHNMWGAEFLPQTRIIPLVDLVITHGGNNTVTECLHFGKPMVVLPLFWDQYDNAQRMQETGFGRRLDTYRFTAADLQQSVAALLDDTRLRARVAEAGNEIRARNGIRKAADLIEGLAQPPP